MSDLHVWPRSPRSGQRGFGYLILLFALALFGVVLAGLGRTWTLATQRERETELLFIGHEFSQALASYRDHSPNGQAKAPQSLDDLVEDKRFPFPMRHLRRLYKDPMTHEADWEIILVEGRIVALHSRSKTRPVRENLPDYVTLQAKEGEQPSYADWVFTPSLSSSQATGPAPPGSASAPIPNAGRPR